jgi:hypothetical protein
MHLGSSNCNNVVLEGSCLQHRGSRLWSTSDILTMFGLSSSVCTSVVFRAANLLVRFFQYGIILSYRNNFLLCTMVSLWFRSLYDMLGCGQSMVVAVFYSDCGMWVVWIKPNTFSRCLINVPFWEKVGIWLLELSFTKLSSHLIMSYAILLWLIQGCGFCLLT